MFTFCLNKFDQYSREINFVLNLILTEVQRPKKDHFSTSKYLNVFRFDSRHRLQRRLQLSLSLLSSRPWQLPFFDVSSSSWHLSTCHRYTVLGRILKK